MGLFLGLSGIIGKTQEEVIASLRRDLSRVGGGLVYAEIDAEYPNCCIIETANGNTTVVYPGIHFQWEQSSAFISEDLKTAVFALHIYDGDFWAYVLYVDGMVVDQFNPIPDFMDSETSKEERDRWKGNAEIIAKYVPGLNPQDINKYLVTWPLEDEEIVKAYPDDVYPQEDMQLLDFMRKLKLPYPLDDDFKSTGKTYRLWTKQLENQMPKTSNAPIEAQSPKETTETTTGTVADASTKQRPWWKFW
jgi:hypothetical protein